MGKTRTSDVLESVLPLGLHENKVLTLNPPQATCVVNFYLSFLTTGPGITTPIFRDLWKDEP